MGIFKKPKLDSFESDSEIKRKLALEGQTRPEISGIKFPKDFDDYSNIAKRRSKDVHELSPRTEETIKVRLPRTSIISFIGDVHAGHPNSDYERLQQEIEVIRNTPDSYVVFTGDLIEGIHWGGASQSEQVMSLDEQGGFLRSMFKKLRGKVLAGVSGEHDSKWAARTGSDPYSQFSEIAEAPYVRGIAELDIDVGEQNYRGVVQHRAKGYSMYNKNHPTFRQARFHNQGADFYVSGHTHQKQVSQEAIREFGKKAREVTHLSIGTYKGSDEYSERKGYSPQAREEMGGASIRLRDDRKKIDLDSDVLEAHRKWNK